MTEIQSPGGASVQADYGNTAPATQYLPSQVTDDSGGQSLFTYNGVGNALTSQDALAATATLTYNSDGTVATALAPGNGSNTTQYAYNQFHQLVSITPMTGGSLGGTTITYDGFDRVHTVTNGDGVTTTYSYDKTDRLLSTTFSDGTHSTVNSYDAAGHRLTRVDGSGTTTNTYDQLGRLTSTVNTAGGGTIRYGYDQASNLISTTDSRGTTTYEFDASGVVTQLNFVQTNPLQPPTGVLGFATDAQGRRTDSWLQTNPDHTVWSAHTHTDYDSTGRVSRVIAQYGTGDSHYHTITDLSYCYNNASPAPTCGTTSTDDRSKLQWVKNNLTGQVTAYTYDAAGRLTGATQTGGTGANTYAYTYDARGNRLTATVTGSDPSSQTFTVNAANQITDTGYDYDGGGNLTADPAGTYTYNGAGQMTTVAQGSNSYAYTYAGTSQNEVLSQQTPDGTYQYVYGRTDQQGQPVIEQVKTAGLTAYVEHDPVTGQPLLLRTSSGKQSLYVYDGTGNPIALLTDDAYQAFGYQYDPYGVPVLTQSSGGSGVSQNPYLFKGGVQDRTTGWVHFGARWYDPATGRYTQQDTIDQPLNPANANQYAYAANDPINRIDPSGQSDCAFLTGFTAISGGIAGGAVIYGIATAPADAAAVPTINTAGAAAVAAVAGVGAGLGGLALFLEGC